ncbi:hypothetical protein THAOC_13408 [Thalassiosira oceanica]|uniref:Uncharacterized protein n=1 Tax=Thalassiosira oceanica TaxID=159749 RepID=K0SHW1_THAOC|nr:hypothetical protein THAOC_13408 [Thalassiosira oceanica]|eukprot:EJK65708.1 hypothetical protein THAOC_13408 [Thalassiosira oceanica]
MSSLDDADATPLTTCTIIHAETMPPVNVTFRMDDTDLFPSFKSYGISSAVASLMTSALSVLHQMELPNNNSNNRTPNVLSTNKNFSCADYSRYEGLNSHLVNFLTKDHLNYREKLLRHYMSKKTKSENEKEGDYFQAQLERELPQGGAIVLFMIITKTSLRHLRNIFTEEEAKCILSKGLLIPVLDRRFHVEPVERRFLDFFPVYVAFFGPECFPKAKTGKQNPATLIYKQNPATFIYSGDLLSIQPIGDGEDHSGSSHSLPIDQTFFVNSATSCADDDQSHEEDEKLCMPGLLHFENISRGFQLKLHSGAHGDDEGGLSDCEWSRLSSLCDLCESHGQDTIDDEFSSFCRKNSGDCDDAKDDDNRGNVLRTNDHQEDSQETPQEYGGDYEENERKKRRTG